jgi:putative molybdopterin biosynthesis protein
MSVYLHDIPLPEAQARLSEALENAGIDGVLGIESIPLDENALGRVLAEAIWAKISSPHYHASAMDGFAVKAGETEGASETHPQSLSFGENALYVDTGDPMPGDMNAVIPIEYVESLSEDGEPSEDPRNPDLIRIRGALAPWTNVRSMGEDMVATQLILPAGKVLRPVDLGAIAGCGYGQINVAKKPKVAIIPTGTELVEIGLPVEVGDIIEYNSVMLASQVNDWGGEAVRCSIAPDDYKIIMSRVRETARDNDLVLIIAGSSAGSEDYTARVVESLGELLVHGVAVRPGHPVILGMVDIEGQKQIPIIGVPGYPVSAALTGELFVKPLLSRWLGCCLGEPYTVIAELTRKITSPPGDDDYIRVAIGRVGEKLFASPLKRGAGVITSLVRADGLALIPRGSQGEPAGAKVKVHMTRSPSELDKTIFAMGSHDLVIDLIAAQITKYDRRLVSANVGSLGGLIALNRGQAHLAGSHLLDPDGGDYNIRYVKEYLPGVRVKIIGFVRTEAARVNCVQRQSKRD